MKHSLVGQWKNSIFKRLRNLSDCLPDRYREASFSQEGEDRLLLRYFRGKKNGFYVDVGAHHPRRFSNTFLMYRLGWRGINIDAAPGTLTRFRRSRPRDIVIESLVSDQPMSLEFHLFSEPALNTADLDLANARIREGRVCVGRQAMFSRRLDDILSATLAVGQAIDFLNVDVEGADLAVLRSNDWNRFRPELVLAENLDSAAGVTEVESSELHHFLLSQGYGLFGKLYNTCIYKSYAVGSNHL